MESISFSILFVLGFSIVGGLVGASFFQKLHIPQVVGFIVIGLIVGDNGLKLVKHTDVTALQPFTLFALGIIGFLVGGELKAETFRKYARQFVAILLGEGLIAFLLVGVSTGLFIYAVFHNFSIAFAAGIVFGAVASATDPASTIDVLWEYRSLGVLTTSLTAIVALDDALAMILYGLATGLVKMTAGVSDSVLKEMGKVFLELIGAVVLGFVGAAILRFLLLRVKLLQKNFAFAIGLLLLMISIAVYANMDVILTSMTMGCILVNMLPKRSTSLFESVRSFSAPIYVLFFVLAGARLSITEMPGWLWGIVIIYVFGRSIGKVVGAYIGARITGSEPVVRRYLGLGLFAQGGVAIGLSIMASHYLMEVPVDGKLMLGDVVIFGIAATTLIVQLFGPPMVKLALKLSGEVGRNVTREDVIDSWTAKDVMETDVITVREGEPITNAAQIFVKHDYLIYPVVDRHDRMVGVLSLEALKNVLSNPDSWTWLLVSDVMRPVEQQVFSSSSLKEVLDQMYELNVDQIPVVEPGNGDPSTSLSVPVGILDRAKIRERIDIEVFRRRQAIEFKRSRSKVDTKDEKMAPRMKLGNMKVRDVRHLLVKDPVIVSPDQMVEDLLAVMNKDPRTRYAYVVNEKGGLVGSVRMSDVVKYLFPFEAVVDSSSELSVGKYASFEAKTVGDIMDDSPRFVKEATSLSDMANILVHEKINELPVVDDQMHIIGQLSLYEITSAYLKEVYPEQIESKKDTNKGNEP